MVPRSAGKDSTTGHWEIAGVHLERPFPTYPEWIPRRGRSSEFSAATGRRRDRQRRGERDGDHRSVRCGARADGRADPVHLGRFGLSGCGARGRRAARRAVPRLRDRARDARRAERRVARDRATVRRHGRARTRGRRTVATSRSRRPGDAARRAGGRGRAASRASGRSTTCSPAERISARTHGVERRGHRGDPGVAPRRPGWVALRQPGRFRPTLSGTGTMCGVLCGRCASSTPPFRPFRAALREDDLLFITADHGNDPTTPLDRSCARVRAAARPRRARCIRCRSANARPSRTWARRWPSGSASGSGARDVVPAGPGALALSPDVTGVEPTPEVLTHAARAGGIAAMERAYAPVLELPGRGGAAGLGRQRRRKGATSRTRRIRRASAPSAVAVGAAIARGIREFVALAVFTEATEPTPPCGVCRQVLMEFAPELPVLSATLGGAEARWLVSDLLPHAFTPTSLGRR